MKVKAWSLALPLVIAGVLLSAFSHRGVAQQAPPAVAAPSDLPAGPGREPFLRVCTGCHQASVATSERRTEESWGEIVDQMRGRGAIGSDDDMDKIITWLAANYSPNAVTAHVNVNNAEAPAIAAGLGLPGEQAVAIVTYRAKNGKFKDLASLELVPNTDKEKIEAAKGRIDF